MIYDSLNKTFKLELTMGSSSNISKRKKLVSEMYFSIWDYFGTSFANGESTSIIFAYVRDSVHQKTSVFDRVGD